MLPTNTTSTGNSVCGEKESGGAEGEVTAQRRRRKRAREVPTTMQTVGAPNTDA
jgi:hypothetical protein